MDQQVPVSFESYYPPFDTWYEVHAYPAPTVLSVYFQDVTERKRNETLLQQVAAGTAQATGEDFFPAFVRYLATTLGVRYAFVTELITPLRVRVIAFWQGDYWGEPFEYDLVETPCKRVIEEGGEYFCPDRVQEVFPRDRDLAQLEAVSYLGMPLWDLSGHIVGHISVLDDKPMTVAEQGRAVFNIFAERAQAEFERKRTQEALQQSEDRYRTFIAQSSEGIWRIEVDCPIPVQTPVEQQLDYFYAHGYLAECNQAMAQMYGFDESEQMVGARLGDLLPRTDERNLSYLRAFIESGYRLTDTESYEVDRTGQPKYFLNNLVGIIEDGYLVRSWGSQRDVTETRRLEAEQQAAEAQLQEATRRAATILDSITEAFYALDHEWRYTHVNQQCEAYYGKTRAELLGRVVWEVFPMAAGSPFEVQYRRAIQEQVAVHFEVLSPFSHRWLEIHAYPSTAGLSVYFRDITNRKQAEKDLNKAVQELTFHMENSPLGVVEWGADFRVARWSPQAEQIFGWSAQEVSGLHPTAWEFVHVDDRPMVAVAMERLLTGGDERGVSPNRNYTKTGQVLHCVWYNSALLDEEGQLVSVLSLVQDVTAQHLARAEREQLLQREQAAREQAQQANRLKDEFLAVVSHELRTPLNAMLGWTQLLRRGNLSAEANQRALETIERNGRAQNELIADILDVSRIIAGKLTLNTVPVQLNTVIQSALESVQLAAEAKGITLVTILNENCEVLGDINRLRQIVWNLLTNAIKFTPNDGQVVVCLDQANQAVLTISDTGMGIDPIFLPHIFERFRQADSTTTRQFGGLGLGLAIVRHLVELHGGTVFAQSAGLSLGATFTVTLPLVAACPQRAISLLSPAPCREEALLTGLKVLVVDDEDDQRELTALILETEGAEVRVAASVQLALVTLGQWNPDVLVSDIAMPGADGYALLRQLAAQGSTIPAVALTAQARAEDRRQSLAQGYRYHLSKPVEAQQLVTIIAELGGKITILRD
ncbi:PAS domain-containing protein [Candidatus Cyanaurora vandensis]